MNNDLEIGYVIEINGNKVVIETNSNANDLTYFYNDGHIVSVLHSILVF